MFHTSNRTMFIEFFDNLLVSNLGKFSIEAWLFASCNIHQLSSCPVLQIAMDQEILPKITFSLKVNL